MAECICKECNEVLEEHRFILCKKCGSIYYVEGYPEEIDKSNIIFYIHCALQSNFKSDKEKLSIIIQLMTEYKDSDKGDIVGYFTRLKQGEYTELVVDHILNIMLKYIVTIEDIYIFLTLLTKVVEEPSKDNVDTAKLLIKLLGIQTVIIDGAEDSVKEQQNVLIEKQKSDDMWQYILKCTGSLFGVIYLMLSMQTGITDAKVWLILIGGMLISSIMVIVGLIRGKQSKAKINQIAAVGDLIKNMSSYTEYIDVKIKTSREERAKLFKDYEDELKEVEVDIETVV